MREHMNLVESMVNQSMIPTFKILNQMVEENVIEKYALCGAMGAFEYIDLGYRSKDIDVSAIIPVAGSIATLTSVTEFLERHGLPAQYKTEGLMIGNWPVQFILPSDKKPIIADALEHAVMFDHGGISIPVWQVEYLIVECMLVGRERDLQRLALFAKSGVYDSSKLETLMRRYAIAPARWEAFVEKATGQNPMLPKQPPVNTTESLEFLSPPQSMEEVWERKALARARFDALPEEERIRIDREVSEARKELTMPARFRNSPKN